MYVQLCWLRSTSLRLLMLSHVENIIASNEHLAQFSLAFSIDDFLSIGQLNINYNLPASSCTNLWIGEFLLATSPTWAGHIRLFREEPTRRVRDWAFASTLLKDLTERDIFWLLVFDKDKEGLLQIYYINISNIDFCLLFA